MCVFSVCLCVCVFVCVSSIITKRDGGHAMGCGSDLCLKRKFEWKAILETQQLNFEHI